MMQETGMLPVRYHITCPSLYNEQWYNTNIPSYILHCFS